jgi:sugar phosphate permease
MIGSGYFLALDIGGFIMVAYPLCWVFYVPACLMGACFIIDVILVRDDPESAGYGYASVSLSEDGEDADAIASLPVPRIAEAKGPSKLARSARKLAGEPFFVCATISLFWNGWILSAILSWLASYLEAQHGIRPGDWEFTLCTSFITVGGIVGGIFCGYVSDRFFSSSRPGPVILFFSGQLASLLVLWFVNVRAVVPVCIGLIFMFVSGARTMLSRTTIMDYAGKGG